MRLSAGFARRAILFLSFSAARGVQMLAPVAVATLLPLAAYGAVEWAHATATLSMSVAMMGVASLIPLYLIRTADGAERRGNVRAACWHSIAVALCGLAAAGLAALALGGGHISVLVCVLIATLASHGFLTGWCRASGRMSVALYLEALPFAAMAVVAALIRWTDAHEPLSVMAASMAAVAAALLLVVLHLAKTWKDQPLDRANYRDTLRAGLPIMIGGLVAVAATLSGRFGAGALGEPETAGAFAAIARCAVYRGAPIRHHCTLSRLVRATNNEAAAHRHLHQRLRRRVLRGADGADPPAAPAVRANVRAVVRGEPRSGSLAGRTGRGMVVHIT
jgi:hypothetical protein